MGGAALRPRGQQHPAVWTSALHLLSPGISHLRMLSISGPFLPSHEMAMMTAPAPHTATRARRRLNSGDGS